MPPNPSPLLVLALAVMGPLLATGGGLPGAAAPGGPGSSETGLPTRGLVVVLRPGDVDPLTRTALARVTGELAAARFRVAVVALDPNVDPTQQVETVTPEFNPVAAFAIAHVSDARGDTVAIWVCDRLGRRTTIQRMAMRGADVSQDAEVLALEAIELIRVSIAGLWPAPATRPVPEEQPTAHLPAHRDRPPVSIGLGVALLQDIGLPSAQWMGALTVIVKPARRVVVLGNLSGFGPGMSLSGNYGTADVHRELGSVGLGWLILQEDHLNVFVAASLGVVHLGASGAAADPTRAHSASAWAALGAAGIGAAGHLGAGISLLVELNGVMTVPPLVLRIADSDTKRFSRPGVLANVGLQATF